MDAIVQTIIPFVLMYKYWALFLITFLTAMALPIPPGTLIMVSSAFAYKGYFVFGFVLMAAIAGNILGDTASYWIARHYGARILNKIGFGKLMHSRRYKIVERAIRKRPGLIIFVSRFEVVTNLSVNLISGLSRLPYGKYLLYSGIGEIFQVTLYSTIGYVFANSWSQVNSLIGKILFLVAVVAVLIVALFWKKIKANMAEDIAAS